MKKMTPLEIFNDFTELVKRIFSFLEDRGFTVEVGKPVAREMSIKYSRPETIIRIHYEVGSGPWITFAKKEANTWCDLNLVTGRKKTNKELLISDFPHYSKPELANELEHSAKAVIKAI